MTYRLNKIYGEAARARAHALVHGSEWYYYVSALRTYKMYMNKFYCSISKF